MENKYLKGVTASTEGLKGVTASTDYFGNRNKPREDDENSVKKFEISTEKYKKRDMTIEIVEYEIKD